MKQVTNKRGKIQTLDIPAPIVEAGHILVAVAYSIISTGTELGGKIGGKSLLPKIEEGRENAQKVIDSIRRQGLQNTVTLIKGKLSDMFPMGYSCAGTVVQDHLYSIRPCYLTAAHGIIVAAGHCYNIADHPVDVVARIRAADHGDISRRAAQACLVLNVNIRHAERARALPVALCPVHCRTDKDIISSARVKAYGPGIGYCAAQRKVP